MLKGRRKATRVRSPWQLSLSLLIIGEPTALLQLIEQGLKGTCIPNLSLGRATNIYYLTTTRPLPHGTITTPKSPRTTKSLMTELDPHAMTTFCHNLVPRILHEACNVDRAQADAIAQDILERAEAFAALDQTAQRVIASPFIEEVSSYQPLNASAELKAAVTVVVRNSQLEAAHANDGPLNAGGIEALTTQAAGPLSHLLTARRRHSEPLSHPSPFADLASTYPRAWAALSALAKAFDAGGRVGYSAPTAPVPSLPDADEVVAVSHSTRDERAFCKVRSTRC